MPDAPDTIAAVATPPGRGGIGIVRISGPRAKDIAAALTGSAPAPRRAVYRPFADGECGILDRGIVLFFPAPASYTGQDVVELHAHGSPVVLRLILQRVLALGARLARPGEFTERAFLNGKLDLAQAEAVTDLIDSASEQAARAALRSLEGAFSQRVHALVEELVSIRAELEALLDFPDEEIDTRDTVAQEERMRALREDLARLVAGASRGRRLREGLRIVILGRPNVGKSSLLNRLTATDRAIVDATPGTTRDTLEETLVVGGISMHIVDTAGVRAAGDAVEAEGVRRALRAVQEADAILLVTEACGKDGDIEARIPEGRPVICVHNKIDLRGEVPDSFQDGGRRHVALSAKTGAGIDLLVHALEALNEAGAAEEDAVLARERHLEALRAADGAVARAIDALAEGRGMEVAAEDLRTAQAALSRITGEFGADDLLGEIFARFCIGK